MLPQWKTIACCSLIFFGMVKCNRVVVVVIVVIVVMITNGVDRLCIIRFMIVCLMDVVVGCVIIVGAW